MFKSNFARILAHLWKSDQPIRIWVGMPNRQAPLILWGIDDDQIGWEWCRRKVFLASSNVNTRLRELVWTDFIIWLKKEADKKVMLLDGSLRSALEIDNEAHLHEEANTASWDDQNEVLSFLGGEELQWIKAKDPYKGLAPITIVWDSSQGANGGA